MWILTSWILHQTSCREVHTPPGRSVHPPPFVLPWPKRLCRHGMEDDHFTGACSKWFKRRTTVATTLHRRVVGPHQTMPSVARHRPLVLHPGCICPPSGCICAATSPCSLVHLHSEGVHLLGPSPVGRTRGGASHTSSDTMGNASSRRREASDANAAEASRRRGNSSVGPEPHVVRRRDAGRGTKAYTTTWKPCMHALFFSGSVLRVVLRLL